MTNTFTERQKLEHEAVTIFNQRAAEYGFIDISPMGTEFDDKDTYYQLRQRSDKTSKMLRHRPDAVCFTSDETILVQIKGGRPKHGKERDIVFVEVDSYAGAMEWNASYRHVAFAFVEIATHIILFTWADQLEFDTIYIPQKHCTHQSNKERMMREYPDKKIKVVGWGGGSGTPCFIYEKDKLSDYLDFGNRNVEV